MLTRDEVFDVISAERDHQNKIWGDLDQRNNIGDFLCYMKRYWDRAVLNNDPDDPEEALQNVKKLTALGVACLERHWKGDE